jgi:hypothetical protein
MILKLFVAIVCIIIGMVIGNGIKAQIIHLEEFEKNQVISEQKTICDTKLSDWSVIKQKKQLEFDLQDCQKRNTKYFNEYQETIKTLIAKLKDLNNSILDQNKTIGKMWDSNCHK